MKTTKTHSLWPWISLAMLIRLILMPITLHGDLIFTNYFPYFLSYHGVWDVYGYFGDHYIRLSGYSFYAPLVYYLIGFFQFIFKILWSSSLFDPFMANVHTLFYEGTAHNLADYLKVFSDRQVMALAFLMKMPYLLAEMICVWLLIKMKDHADRPYRALQIWLFNPVLIFSVYIFGTYRIYTMLVVVLVVFFLRKSRNLTACFFFGCLLLLDNFPWFLLIPSILILDSTWKGRLKLALGMILPFAIVFIPLYFSSKGYVMYAYVSPIFKKAITQSLTRSFMPQQITIAAKALFLILYGGMLLKLFISLREKRMPQERKAQLFVWVSAWILLVFYASNQTLIQYFTWALPFFILIQAEDDMWRGPVAWTLIGALFLFNLDSRALNGGLFLPLNRQAMEWPSFHEWAASFFPYGKLVAVSRWLFSGLCLYFAFRLYQSKIKPLLDT